MEMFIVFGMFIIRVSAYDETRWMCRLWQILSWKKAQQIEVQKILQQKLLKVRPISELNALPQSFQEQSWQNEKAKRRVINDERVNAPLPCRLRQETAAFPHRSALRPKMKRTPPSRDDMMTTMPIWDQNRSWASICRSDFCWSLSQFVCTNTLCQKKTQQYTALPKR